MLLTFNHQHLNRFEGFAHGENYVFSRITFPKVNCMPSKFNCFVYKEQRSIFPNHFKRYLEVLKESCDVLKTVELSLFAREASKPMS